MHNTIQIHPGGEMKVTKNEKEKCRAKKRIDETNEHQVLVPEGYTIKETQKRSDKTKEKYSQRGSEKKISIKSTPPPKTEYFIPEKVKPPPVKGKQRGSIVITDCR